jgi:cellulose synthase operon protein C
MKPAMNPHPLHRTTRTTRRTTRRTISRKVGRAALALAVSASLLLAGCAGESEADLVASAKGFIDKNDNKAAVIQLKNALQKNGEAAEARLLLGQVMLKMGDPSSAAVELAKARSLKVDDDRVAPDLARALLTSGQDDKVIAQFATVTLREPEPRARLATQLASAYMVRGELRKTKDQLAAALAALPTHAPAITLQARLQASAGDVPGALAALDAVLQREPGQIDAGLFKGEVLRATGQLPAALTSYQAVLAQNPESIAVHSAVVLTQLALGQKDAAVKSLEALQRLAPGHPDALYYEAQLAYDAGDYVKTRELSDRVLKMIPESLQTLQLAAATEYRRGDYAQAELFLTKALKIAPGLPLARHMLAQTYLRIGQPDRALDALRPLLDAPKVPASTLAIAGETYLLQGDAKRAEEAFAAASRMAPDDVALRTSLAMSQLARSQGSSEALRALEKLSGDDANPRADLALISARLSLKDYTGALQALQSLEKKQPDRALPHYLRGRIQLAQNDGAGARASFEAALRKEAKYLPAANSLASLDLAAGKREAARERMQAMVKADPTNAAAHLALAEVATRAGASAADITQLLTTAVRANGAEPRAHVALVNHLLATGDTRAALTAAQTAAAAMASDASVQDVLGRAQLAGGDPQQALTTWRNLANQQPRQPMHQLRLAEVYASGKSYDEAERSLKRALELQPGLLQAERALVTLAIQRGQPQDGLPVARGLQKRLPKSSLGWILEGDVEAARKNMPLAIAAYRTAVQREAPTEAAIRLHRSLQLAGQEADASAFAAQWQKAQSRDALFRYYLGDLALAKRDLTAAETHYRQVLEVDPDNALAMNNIAWILATQGKPGAVAMANKANELAPDRPPVLDTLALALAAEGQLPRAVEAQKRALALAPNEASFKLALAKLYLKSGEKSLARSELEDISRLGDKFANQAQVQELLQQAR